ncbi:putative MFS family arabinose efflux permease [Streptomyces sp. 846.5]|nr:MFS transporter [Streptomyces sp. 846.5]TDU02293.1 putative MFS family arabinose efflux permease [Streptomyces sp. 846.5]
MPVDPRSTRAPLRYPAFRLLVAGRAVNTLGSGVAPIALAFAVLDLTGSVNDLGLVVGARSLFNVVFLLFGGVVADRLPRHLVMVGSGLLSGASQAAVAALVLTHSATIPTLLLLSAANGTFAAFALPASSALVPQTVPEQLRQSANALNRMVGNAAQIIGTSLGGVLVATVGAGWGLAADAMSFLLSALLLLRVRVPSSSARPAEDAGLIGELREGWQEFTARTWVWVVVVAFGFINAALVGATSVLGPTVADATFGRSWWGGVLAAETAGMVVGGLVALRFRPHRLLLVGVVCVAAEVTLPLGLALHVPVYALTVAAFLCGMCLEQFAVAWETSLQQEIPANRLARVYSYDMLGSFVAIPLAQVTVGPLASAFGVRDTLLGAAGIIALSTLAMLAVRDVRALPAAPPSRALRTGIGEAADPAAVTATAQPVAPPPS